jgi:N-hydroxyarylamine O-acetyltransferase
MPFDLAAYLVRVGYDGPRGASFETLSALHRAHALAVPFENLDIHVGRPIRLELAWLFEKVVTRRRGGYCFEQNTLFLAALGALGFEAIACEARVVSDESPGAIRPRTHMTLVASVAGHAFLCDVGFGADGPVEPVPMDGTEVVQLGDRLRVEERSPFHVLQALRGGDWRDQYVFRAEERYPVDFEVANWYTSTYPESRFVKTLTAQRVRSDGRHVLRNLAYSVRLAESVTESAIARDEVVPLLRGVFGIDLPDGTRLSGLDDRPRDPQEQ